MNTRYNINLSIINNIFILIANIQFLFIYKKQLTLNIVKNKMAEFY